jgi:hypothetical protein
MDATRRPALRVELERSIRESPRSGNAYSLLANLDMLDGSWARALADLQAARAVYSGVLGLNEREAVCRDSLAAQGARR